MHTDAIQATTTKIYWGRVLLWAFLLELVLGVTLIPLQFIFGMTFFLVAVPIGCFAFGFLLSMWMARKLRSSFAMNGAVMGIIATIIYLGLSAFAPGSLPAAVAVYGLPLFVFANALRIAGCIAGAWVQGRRGQRA